MPTPSCQAVARRSVIEPDPLDAIRCLGILEEGAFAHPRSQSTPRCAGGLARVLQSCKSHVEILKAGYEAFGRGDVPSVLAIFDPSIEWREAEGNPYKPDGKAWIGGDAIVEHLFMRLATEWDGFTVTPEELHDAGPVRQDPWRPARRSTARPARPR